MITFKYRETKSIPYIYLIVIDKIYFRIWLEPIRYEGYNHEHRMDDLLQEGMKEPRYYTWDIDGSGPIRSVLTQWSQRWLDVRMYKPPIFDILEFLMYSLTTITYHDTIYRSR